MGQLSESKKLARIEVLVVVLVCLFLLGIFPLACRKSRLIDFRMTCGINLSSIGKAMQVYAKDYDGEFPRAGGKNSVWSSGLYKWAANDRNAAYGLDPKDGSGGAVAITSSFYLLIKYAGISPKSFICPGDKGVTEFNPVDYGARGKELTEFWDFGAYEPREHCSYSYHMPYGLFPLTSSSEPGMAVAADPNPWMYSPSAKGKDPILLAQFNPDAGFEAAKIGNAITHKESGQNVLFMDGYVYFERHSFCGINNDNIYTYWNGGDIRRGGLPFSGTSEPTDRLDSFLVNDPRAAIGPKPTFKEINR